MGTFALVICGFTFLFLGNCHSTSEHASRRRSFESDTQTQDVPSGANSQRQNEQIEIMNFMIFTKIIYRYARTMTFCEMRNLNSSEAREANFSMVLPEGAFVSNFTMEINGNQYKSFIKEKAEANRNYTSERNLGNNAGIINHNEDKKENKFQISTSLAANATVLFYLEYEEEIAIVNNGDGHFRYSVSILPQIISSVKHFCVDVDIKEFKKFSIRHLNLCNERGSCSQVDIESEAVLLNRADENTRIIWEPSKSSRDEFLRNGVFAKFGIEYEFTDKSETNDVLIRNGYFIHRFRPQGLPKLPLHIVFVLDVSESMCGERMEQMKSAMTKILDDMQSKDYFNIVTFSLESQNWVAPINLEGGSGSNSSAYPADFYMKEIAKAHINSLECEGSTNIFGGLVDAFEIIHKSKSEFENNTSNKEIPNPMIFFLSDGEPTSGQIIDRLEILREVQLMNDINVPIFSLAFGETADYSLLQTLSSQNLGIARVIYDNADASLQLEDFYEFVSSPVLTNISFSYTSNSSLINITDVTTDKKGDLWLPEGQELVIGGRIHVSMNNRLAHLESGHGVQTRGWPIEFAVGTRDIKFNARICPCGACPDKSGNHSQTDLNSRVSESGILCDGDINEDLFLERFWVHKTIQNLIRKVIKSGNMTIKQEIIELAKEYNLVTPYTSLLIIAPLNKRVTYNALPVSNLTLQRDTDTKTAITKPKPVTRFSKRVQKRINAMVFYSSSPNTTRNEINETPKLSDFYKSLIQEKDNAVRLRSIKWLENKMYLQFMNGNEIDNYEILSSVQSSSDSMKTSCRKGGRKYGKCTHLIDCIQDEFMNDIKVFIKSYFCPLRENGKLFVGVCCTSGS